MSVITARVNSYGGSVTDGLAIFNALRRHKATVHTHNDGLAASIYKQAEQANILEDYRAAAGHFLRIKTLAPTSSIRSSAEYDAAIAWDDQDIGIDWPIGSGQLSAKDAAAPRLADIDRD